MIPLAGSAFWGPMAITIKGGMMGATVLTLNVVPRSTPILVRVREDEPASDRFIPLILRANPKGGSVSIRMRQNSAKGERDGIG